ncbi:MAG: hypothetical protein ABL901_02900 [Hyphomicrobiaceae bacterium]
MLTAEQYRRSLARAERVIERAARMKQFRAKRSVRGLFDRQMRTPGYVKSEPFKKGTVLPRTPRTESIPLNKLRTTQASVSVAEVKRKMRSLKSDDGRLPGAFYYKGKYYANDGNHRYTALRALGAKFAKAEVVELIDRKQFKAELKQMGKYAGSVGAARLRPKRASITKSRSSKGSSATTNS